LCETNSIEAMKKTIGGLLDDQELSNKLSRNAEEFVRENCAEKNYASHLNDFLKLNVGL